MLNDASLGRPAVPFWRLWIACLLGYLAIGATLQIMPKFVATRLHGGPFAAGLAVTVGFLATMASRPVAGWFADRHGSRPVVLWGALLAALGGASHAIASGMPQLIGARLLLGVGEGALFTAAIGWVLTVAPEERRGRVAGRFGLSMWGGLTIGPLVGSLVAQTAGIEAVWLAAAILPFVGALMLSTTRHKIVRNAPARQSAPFRLPRGTLGASLSYVFASTGYGVIAACLVPRLHGIGLSAADVALSIFGAAFLAARFVGSPLVDRYGPSTVLVIGLLAEATGLGGIAWCHTSASELASVAVVGIGLAVIYPCYVALVVRTALQNERTVALGLMISAWDLGVAVGGPMGGLLVINNYSGAFAAAAGASVIAATVFVTWWCRCAVLTEVGRVNSV